ncbi:MAG: acylphosphatase [Pacificimonas sp.]
MRVPTTSKRFRVHGKVQGVWYRGWTVDTANALDLAGWVRNRRDGTVEILASGPPDKVDALAAKLKTGPEAARVDRVEAVVADEAIPMGFAQRPTR